MINIWIVLGILFMHWIGDFVLQTHEQSIKKSTDVRYLLRHTINYSSIWFAIGTIWSISSNIYTHFTYLFSWWIVWKFSIITFICHTITDYFTSKLNSKLWKQGKVHNFFVSIGFDQFLHISQLVLTFYFLNR